jgi:iron complex outermembrane receptor protein
MKLQLILFCFTLCSLSAFGQNTLTVAIKDKTTQEPLIGATAVLKGTTIGSTTDTNGMALIIDIPDGTHIFEFRFIGYETYSDTFIFPTTKKIEIFLEPEEDELETFVFTSTRSSRTIEDIPTRVEFIAGEELEEKSNMKPGDIRMILSESTGIQTQITSATSANASIRIQGLDGRYTQILKDGLPLYSGAASGLGLLQIPPLDLERVEVIKGSSSTLYGGGAIAGMVNLITKTPTEERDLQFHLNGSTGKGYDINGFFGQRFGKIGTTIFVSNNRNWAYDPADIPFTAIPEFNRFVFNPKLFVYFNDKTKLNFGVNTTIEDRIGGDKNYIAGNGDSTHSYFEKNQTQRYSTQFSLDHTLNEKSFLNFKNSVSYFHRIINIPNYTFDGTQIASFSEASYSNIQDKVEWVAGLNLWTDNFQEVQVRDFPLRNYTQTTFGAFVQNSWKIHQKFILESGLRTDYVVDYGVAVLPRISALYKISNKFSTRLGGGVGYKSPTIFTEESERVHYQNVLPIDDNLNTLERSYGGNLDFNYKTSLGKEVSFSINQLFFYTYLDRPLLLESVPNGLLQFVNSTGNIDTRGMETNVKLGYKDFVLFLGYTYTDARVIENGISRENFLTSKNRINSVLMYEVEEKWKVGLECYYYSPQLLSDGATGRDYVLMGFMVEKLWENFSIYWNFENFLDARQTRFDSIYTGPVNNPQFRDIYAPLDGFLMNGGIKIKL